MTETSGPDAMAYRDVLGRFGSGVVVVAGMADGIPAGLTCQSFIAVSLDPPLVAVSPSIRSRSWRRIQPSGAFAVNVLTAQQRQLCLTFADGGGRDKFATTGWHRAPSGSPVIDNALAWVDCRIESVRQAGDHFLVLARVEHLQGRSGEPLMFYRGGFGTFSADRAARPREPSRMDWTADDVWGTGLWQEGLDW